MATETQLKFMQRLTKKGKGAVDLDGDATSTLGLIGYDVQPIMVVIDLAKHNDGNGIVDSLLKDWAKRNHVRYISSPKYSDEKPSERRWTIHIDEPGDPVAAAFELAELATVVDSAPDPQRSEPGALYLTAPERSGMKLIVKSFWLGGTGWRVVAPSGKSVEVAAPVNRRTGMPIAGPQNLATLWTFLYKNGADEAAKSFIDAQDAGEVAELTAPKAERERIARRRSSLPEIEKIFVQVTQARYDEVVTWLTGMYIGSVETALRLQDETGRLRSQSLAHLPGAAVLMTQQYDADRKWVYVPKPGYEKLAHEMAVRASDSARDAFVEKNTFRISEISRLKGMVPEAELISIDPGASFNSRIRFRFPDTSSFELRNKTVWKTSPLGVYFAQFPTTFHDVVLPSGKPMKGPSEAKMIDVFAAKADNPVLRRRAARLARGG